MNSWDGVNRRKHIRAEFPYTIHLFTLSGKPIATYTEDISEGGVKIVTQKALAAGDKLELKLYIADNFIRCKGTVSWAREKTNTVLDGVVFYSAGIEFGALKDTEKEVIAKCVEELRKGKKKKSTKGKK